MPEVAAALGPAPTTAAETAPIMRAEGITLRFGSKVPGHLMEVRDVNMDFSYGAAFAEDSPEAYERLIYDAMRGDQTLFAREDAVQEAWRIVEPVLGPCSPLLPYEPGTWGPDEANRLVNHGSTWHHPAQDWDGK